MIKLKIERKLSLDEKINCYLTLKGKKNLSKKRERMPDKEEEETKTYYFRKKIQKKTVSVKPKHNNENSINNQKIINCYTRDNEEDEKFSLDIIFDKLTHISLNENDIINNNDNIAAKKFKNNNSKENINTYNIISQSTSSKINEIINHKSNNSSNNQLLFFRSLNRTKVNYKFIGRQKIDLILDIDQTLLFTRINRSNNPEKFPLNEINEDHIYLAQFKSNSNAKVLINYQIQLRKGLKAFLEALSCYCNLYINTHSQDNYAKEVINIISNKTGISIPTKNIISSKSPQEYKLKSMGKLITNDNFLIIDDSLCAWESKYHHQIIPSMKYQGFCFSKKINQSCIYDTHYQFLMCNSSPFEINEIENELFDENNVLFSMETDQSDICQLNYLQIAIKKAYYLSFIFKKPIHLTLYYIRSLVLTTVQVYLFLDCKLELISDIILILGGSVVNDIDQATHIIYNKSKDIIDTINKEKKYNVNLKWLFHCYFYIEKMNENNIEYSV